MKRILVVDDNAAILEVFKIILEARGYEVLALEDGEQTLRTVDQFLPDLIILDLNLSGKDGLELCTELKASPDTKHIPVIVMSAYFNVDTISKVCIADAVLPKPFNLSHLTAVIESQLNKIA